MANKPIYAGYAKTGADVGGNRKLDSGFRVKGFQELAETNASEPTVQLLSIRVVLDVIARRKWDFRAIGRFRILFKVGAFKTRRLRKAS